MADDDDWVGTPPEGRHTRDRARPEYWWSQRPPQIVGGLLALLLVILLIAVLAG